MIIYKDIDDLDIDIKCYGYEDISDHKALQVRIKLPQDMENRKER